MDDLARFCDEWFAAWTGGDPEGLLAYYAEDAQYADPAKPHGIRGREALRKYFGRLLPANPDMVWTRRELFPIEGGFAVTWTARIPVGGRVVEERGCDLVWLRDGRTTGGAEDQDATGRRVVILRNEVYFDRAAWLDALSVSKRQP